MEFRLSMEFRVPMDCRTPIAPRETSWYFPIDLKIQSQNRCPVCLIQLNQKFIQLNRNLISFKMYSIYLFPTVCQFIKNALSLQHNRCTAFHFQVDLQICWYNSIVHSKLEKKIAWASKQQPIKNKPEMASFNRFPKFRCWPIYSIVI